MNKRNENKPGYKKTKVGLIPEEWSTLPFSSIIKKSQYGLSISPSVEGHTPLLRMGNIENGKVTYKNLTYVDIPNNVRNKYLIKENDLLFNRTNSLDHIGKLGIVTNLKNSVFASYIVRFQIKKTKAYPSFVAYYFNTHDSRNRLKRLATPGVCQYNINQSDLQKQFTVPLPPLPEQKKIAEILSTWDEAIDRTRKLIDAKKHRKKALMQQLLSGKKRLKGFEKSKIRKPYRFFDVPEDWGCPLMKEIASECTKRNAGGSEITVLSCSKHMGFVESSQYFGKKVFSEDTSNYKVIRKYWFGYPSNHIEEGSIGLLLDHDIGIVSPIYTIFKCGDSVIPEYLYAVFKTDTFRHIFAISTNASVDRRGSLRWKEFSLIRVPLPPKEEQAAIINIFQTADKEINSLEKKLSALETQKRGLMQKLLTGEVRVNT